MMPVALEIPPAPSPYPHQNTLPTYAPVAEILLKRNEAFCSIILKVILERLRSDLSVQKLIDD